MKPTIPPINTSDRQFHDGDIVRGELGTIVTAEHMNNVQDALQATQDEVINVITAAGINVDDKQKDQLLKSINTLIDKNVTPESIHALRVRGAVVHESFDVKSLDDVPSNCTFFVYGGSADVYGSGVSFAGLSDKYPAQLVTGYSDSTKIKYRTKNGDLDVWNQWYQLYHDGNKPTAEDIGAFALGKTGDITVTDRYPLAWDAPSGAYNIRYTNHYSNICVHFSLQHPENTPALQLMAKYRNGGLWYRSARDDHGFEAEFDEIVTTRRLSNLINDYLPVGIPQPWGHPVLPLGWLKCNGAAFDKNMYPELAKVYPWGTVPDLRGEFIRGWDDGRGIDNNRGVLSAQSDALQEIYGEVSGTRNAPAGHATGAFAYVSTTNSKTSGAQWGENSYGIYDFKASRIARTANETRPRNISFLYIVRAA